MPQDKIELLQELVNKYLKMYMKYACKQGVPYDDVEDIVMDAFWAFYDSEHFGKLDEEATKAMMARIVRNKCIDLYRKNNRVETVDLESGVGELELIGSLYQNDPADEVIGNESRNRVYECMKELSGSLRDTAIMYFIEERTYEEICETLGISDTTCRTRISRARKFLKEKLAEIL